MTYQLIETRVLTTTTSAISITNIPQTFNDLLIVTSARSTRAATVDGVDLFPNGDTNVTVRRILGPNVLSDSGGGRIAGLVSDNGTTANTFGTITYYFPSYRSNLTKLVFTDSVSENQGDGYQQLQAGVWNNTAAITSLSIVIGTGPNFVIGTSVSIYGITRGSSNGVVVS